MRELRAELPPAGADSLSQSVRPNQKVGRSSKFHVPPEPSCCGFVDGSSGRRSVYVMSFAEPGSDDLNATDGSSWPTYVTGGLEGVATQRVVALAERLASQQTRGRCGGGGRRRAGAQHERIQP
jgi:hypothetical protein